MRSCVSTGTQCHVGVRYVCVVGMKAWRIEWLGRIWGPAFKTLGSQSSRPLLEDCEFSRGLLPCSSCMVSYAF